MYLKTTFLYLLAVIFNLRKTHAFFRANKVARVKIEENSEVSMWKDICYFAILHVDKIADEKTFSSLLCLYMKKKVILSVRRHMGR